MLMSWNWTLAPAVATAVAATATAAAAALFFSAFYGYLWQFDDHSTSIVSGILMSFIEQILTHKFTWAITILDFLVVCSTDVKIALNKPEF